MTNFPDEVIKIDREYIENYLKNTKSPLIDKNGTLENSTFDAIAQKLYDNVVDYIQNCLSRVERDIERFERNMGARDTNPHYKLYSSWDNDDIDLVGVFTNLSDAREMIREDWRSASDQCEYKITEVKDGVEGTKNFYQPTLF